MVSYRRTLEKRRRCVAGAVGVTLVVSLTLFAVGLVFIINKDCSDQGESVSDSVDQCKHSEEAKTSGLIDLLGKVRQNYKKFLSVRTFKGPASLRNYLDPKSIKETTDAARVLLEDFNSLRIDTSALTPRELKGLAELQQFLEHNFGQAYDDYYTGAWLLGPNIMCAHYMCRRFMYDVSSATANQPIETVQDVAKFRDTLAHYGRLVHQYMENIREGVKSGMVRSVEACLAGAEALKANYLKIAELDASGILQEWFVAGAVTSPRFLSKLDTKEKEKWFRENRKSVNESIGEFLVEYLGKPLEELLRFLEYENILHCVPGNVSSGLANLPLSHVYFNGTKTNTSTIPFLPTGEKLDGRKMYQKLLRFHTTTNLTADEVYELGWKNVKRDYLQIIEVAKNVTGFENESVAIERFKVHLLDRSQYFNEKPFPQNESFEEARKNCQGIANAKKFCPKRWQAMQAWFDWSTKFLSKLELKTVDLLYFTGLKKTTPSCPVQLTPSFMSFMAAPVYQYAGRSCSRPARFELPFFNDNYGPRFMELSINAHEGRPGHHTQVQGYLENFRSGCPYDDLSWLDRRTTYTAFSEGWGLYAESPLIAKYTGAYENDPLSQYGILKAQIWRALRLVVDSGLHHKGMKRHEALDLFDRYMWDTSDLAAKEVTRYQSVQGQATSYKIGQLTLIDLQNYASEELAEKFNMRDFHYELLRHGSVPLHYIKYQVKKYVACEKDKQSADCKYTWSAASVVDGKDSAYSTFSEDAFDFQEFLITERYY